MHQFNVDRKYVGIGLSLITIHMYKYQALLEN